MAKPTLLSGFFVILWTFNFWCSPFLGNHLKAYERDIKITIIWHRYSSHWILTVLFQEVRLAIEYIVIPGGEPVELLPRRSDIVARQLELVKSYHLAAENSGTELNPRLQILPLRLNKKSSSKSSKSGSTSQVETSQKSLASSDGGTSVTRLPFLPE